MQIMIVIPRQVLRQPLERTDELGERIVNRTIRLGHVGSRRHRHLHLRAVRKLHAGRENDDAASHYSRVAHGGTLHVRAIARKEVFRLPRKGRQILGTLIFAYLR